MGDAVGIRLGAIMALGLAVAGCSETAIGPLPTMATASLQPLPAPERSASGAAPVEARSQPPTMASKVLSAIALERVTGRKADPGRLAEPN